MLEQIHDKTSKMNDTTMHGSIEMSADTKLILDTIPVKMVVWRWSQAVPFRSVVSGDEQQYWLSKVAGVRQQMLSFALLPIPGYWQITSP